LRIPGLETLAQGPNRVAISRWLQPIRKAPAEYTRKLNHNQMKNDVNCSGGGGGGGGQCFAHNNGNDDVSYLC